MSRKKEYVLLVILGVIFLAAGGYLFQVWEDYHEASAGYQKLQKFIIEKPDVGRDSKGKSKNQEDPEENLPEIDFDGLRAINGDIVAWIQIPGINVDYPVVQGKDNDEYLHKTFSANENTLGTIFLNVDNNANFLDENSILYGHYMNDGSMFRHLEDYKDKAFWEANPYFYIYTPDGQELVYHIYSVGEVLDTSDTYLTDFPTNDDYQKFLNMTKEVAMYDTGIEVTTGDTIVTLSTCTSANNDHRFVVRGVKVRE